ncbi:MAG: M23 family metallopeptidase, partial [Flavobacteriales bacterium]|nr:M23 family metallopeptidase [Flavobacteriales bacterium]
MRKFISVLLFIFCFLTSSNAQDFPQGYFRSPLDIPIFLAGNFGEIRNNHFHAGLDMKTESVEGKNIYAVADGYVSRIKIGHGGYGKALYVTHTNGYTSVYAHLQDYEGTIGEYVKKAQYQKESYEIELFPSKTMLTVSKGDIIALSGNSGG